ncbi:MAG: ankyrin repeat domain-containing protein [Actinomycetes bacterium]|jgi:hypothetical protein|nr:MAG: ankyrin repeat domain-containing protein [Actinomycetota bacterium]
MRRASTWDGVTRRETYKEHALQVRDRLADAARDGDWAAVFAVLDEHPEWINGSRVGGTSGYTPLHQAAWHGAAAEVVERLVAMGAWRTLRTAAGERAADIAARKGHRHLAEPLTPVIRHPVPPEALQAIERHFHAVIHERAGELVARHGLRLPLLEPLTEQEDPSCWFRVPGMYGGFAYRLQGVELVVESWCRVVGGSGQRHVIRPDGARLVSEGFV